MQKNLFIFPLLIFFFIILVFSYFLIIKRDPSELPSALINKKAPMFKSTSLFDDETILANEIFGEETREFGPGKELGGSLAGEKG